MKAERLRLSAAERARLDESSVWWPIIIVLAFAAWISFGLPKAHAEGLFLELGAGVNPGLEQGSNPVSVIRGRWELADNGWLLPDVVEWDHHSSIFDGKPLNHRPEESRDQFSLVWRIKIK